MYFLLTTKYKTNGLEILDHCFIFLLKFLFRGVVKLMYVCNDRRICDYLFRFRFCEPNK